MNSKTECDLLDCRLVGIDSNGRSPLSYQKSTSVGLLFVLWTSCLVRVHPSAVGAHTKHITNNILVKQRNFVIIKLLLSAFTLDANKCYSIGNNTCCSQLFNTGFQSMLAFVTRSQLKRNCPWVFSTNTITFSREQLFNPVNQQADCTCLREVKILAEI